MPSPRSCQHFSFIDCNLLQLFACVKVRMSKDDLLSFCNTRVLSKKKLPAKSRGGNHADVRAQFRFSSFSGCPSVHRVFIT